MFLHLSAWKSKSFKVQFKTIRFYLFITAVGTLELIKNVFSKVYSQENGIKMRFLLQPYKNNRLQKH